jgi:flagellar hook-length control protein FliK
MNMASIPPALPALPAQNGAARSSPAPSLFGAMPGGQTGGFDLLLSLFMSIESVGGTMDGAVQPPADGAAMTPAGEADGEGSGSGEAKPRDRADRAQQGFSTPAMSWTALAGAWTQPMSAGSSQPTGESTSASSPGSVAARTASTTSESATPGGAIETAEGANAVGTGKTAIVEHAWNVQELAHRIGAALESSPATRAEAEMPATAKKEFGQAQAATQAATRANMMARIHASAQSRVSIGTVAGAIAGAPEAEAAQAIEAAKAPAGQSGEGVQPHRATPAARAYESGRELSEYNLAKLPQLIWTAQPVVDGDGTSRMPALVEQLQQVVDFVAQHASGVVKLGDHGVEANLRLYPPDLGGVRIVVNVRGDHAAQAMFTVERAETAALLNQHLDQLRDNLNRHGLSVDRLTVAVQARAVAAATPDSMAAWNERQDAREGFARREPSRQQNPDERGRGREWERAREDQG